jgi:hypothetical protein
MVENNHCELHFREQYFWEVYLFTPYRTRNQAVEKSFKMGQYQEMMIGEQIHLNNSGAIKIATLQKTNPL